MVKTRIIIASDIHYYGSAFCLCSFSLCRRAATIGYVVFLRIMHPMTTALCHIVVRFCQKCKIRCEGLRKLPFYAIIISDILCPVWAVF